MNKQAALRAITALQAEEIKRSIAKEHQSFVLIHEKPVSHAVVMLHGYTASPLQYKQLAQRFYLLGYNVYVPLLPKHGTGDYKDTGTLLKSELTQAGEAALHIGMALAPTVGLIGISAGANLATWLVYNSSITVQRLLLIAPFYEPNKKRIPVLALRIAVAIYGHRLLPNLYTQKFSFYTLAQLVSLARPYVHAHKELHLLKVGLVVGSDDLSIDQYKALQVAQNISKNASVQLQAYTTPLEWHAGHDIVTPGSKASAGKTAELYSIYEQYYQT